MADNKFVKSQELELILNANKNYIVSELAKKANTFDVGEGLKLENGQLDLTIDHTLYKIVTEKPTTAPTKADANKIHLVANSAGSGDDTFTEYIWNGSKWEQLGSFKADFDSANFKKELFGEIEEKFGELEDSIEAKAAKTDALKSVSVTSGGASLTLTTVSGASSTSAIPVASSTTLGFVKSSTTGTGGTDCNVQVNTDGTMKVNVPKVTKSDIESVLTGTISSHNHNGQYLTSTDIADTVTSVKVDGASITYTTVSGGATAKTAGTVNNVANATNATTATNLADAPSLAYSGNTITVTAGNKTSTAFTVPYATNAGTAGSATSATNATNATNLVDAPELAAGTTDTKKITVKAGNKTSAEFTVPFATEAGSAATAITATNLSGKPSLAGSTKITVTVGGQTSNEFTVPFSSYCDSANYASSAGSASNSLQLGGVAASFYALKSDFDTMTDAEAKTLATTLYGATNVK